MTNETNTQRGGLHAYTIIVGAGKNAKREVRGCTIRVADAPYPVTITAHAKKLNGQRGTNFSLDMKKFEKWFTDIEYDEIEVFNSGSTEITVVLQLGYGDFEAEILSRTLAAPSFSVSEFDMSCTLEEDEKPSEANGGLITLCPENGQRKRVKIAAYAYNFAVTGDPGVALWFGVSDIPNFDNVPPPAYPGMHAGDGGPNYLNAASSVDQAEPFFIGEWELETTATVYGISDIVAGNIAAGTSFTYQLKWVCLEELYSAS